MSPPTPARTLQAVWLGTRPYRDVYALQCELLTLRKIDQIPDTVLLLEHEPTVTTGRGTRDGHLLTSAQMLAVNGITLVESDRGGDVTLHAPGQLVAYPIIKLDGVARDVRKYVNALTRVMQSHVKAFGIDAGTMPGLVGLWVDNAERGQWRGQEFAQQPVKVGAIGVRISRWVTMHGFALNLTTDLSLFRHIVPCGIREFGVASVESLSATRGVVAEEARRTPALLAAELGLTAGAYHAWDGPLRANTLEQMLT